MHHAPAHLPDYDELAHALQQARSLCTPSELQGLLCGLLAGGARLTRPTLSKILEAHLEFSEPLDEDWAGSLWSYNAALRLSLADDDYTFTLCLPDDDAPMRARVEGLGAWCNGFLFGFGTALRKIDESRIGEDVHQALADIAEIARVDTAELSEQDEVDLMHLVEYLRLAAIMIFTTFLPDQERTPTDAVEDDAC